MSNPIRIIYILGHGRSGSTYLDALLSEVHSGVSIGQFIGFPKLIPHLSLHKCSCGDTLLNCEQWGAVLEKSDTESLSNLAHPLFNSSRSSEIRGLIKTSYPAGLTNDSLGKAHEKILKICESYSIGRYLVDSSKNTTRLRALHASAEYDVTTVFLIRGVTGVSRSKMKNKSFKRRPRLLSSLSWAIQNMVAAIYYQSIVGKKMIVKFEEFIETPVEHINSVFDVGHFDVHPVVELPKVSHQHMMSGNSIRHENSLSISQADMEVSVFERIIELVIEKPVYWFLTRMCKRN